VTKDDYVIMASEAGVLPVEPERVASKGRLQPGRMFLVNMQEGRIVADEEIKQQIALENPYRRWLDENLVKLADISNAPEVQEPDHGTVLQRQLAFGYTFEDQRKLLVPMAKDGVEAMGSMGTDIPLAVLSNKSKLLYDYFKQLFAQVTNPPIDCIREEIVTSSVTTIGPERNLLEPNSMSCHLIELPSPILTNEEFAKIRRTDLPGLKTAVLTQTKKIGPAAQTEGAPERADLAAVIDAALGGRFAEFGDGGGDLAGGGAEVGVVQIGGDADDADEVVALVLAGGVAGCEAGDITQEDGFTAGGRGGDGDVAEVFEGVGL
jgi:glutamate synthase (ferredoxin)